MATKHFTFAERRAILEKSRRLLDDDEHQLVPTPPVKITFEDPMDKWRREANEIAAQRAAADAERRAAEQAAADQRNAAVKQASAAALAANMALEQRVADLENQVHELSAATMGFSDAATTGLHRLEPISKLLGGVDRL
jgi:hypothetical protein